MTTTTTTIDVPAVFGPTVQLFVKVHVAEASPEKLARLAVLTAEVRQTDAYCAARERLDEAMDLLDLQPIFDLPLGVPTTQACALFAQDRGLITDADFTALVAPWINAGLSIPHRVTGDDPMRPDLKIRTIDRLADDLLTTAFTSDWFAGHYSALLVLTGYNHGELLAYPQIRRHISGGPNTDQMHIDWDSLRDTFERGDLDEADVPEDAQTALSLAIMLSPVGVLHDASHGLGDDNAEALLTAYAYSIGGQQHLLGMDLPEDAAGPAAGGRWDPDA